MKNQKAISKLVLLVFIIIIIVAAIYWVKYFAKPMTTVMTGGIERAQPAIDKAKQASDAMNRVTQKTDEMARKMSEDAGK